MTRPQGLAARWSWRPLLGLSTATAVAWTMFLALIDGWQRGVTGRLMTPTEYLHRRAPRVGDVGAMLRSFAEHIQGLRPGSWTTQVAGHPPGALLVFVIRYYQPGEYGLVRPYGYWCGRIWRAWWWSSDRPGWPGCAECSPRPGPTRGLVLLCAAAGVAVLAADLSGLSKAEVEPIWLPFAVWLIASTRLLPAR